MAANECDSKTRVLREKSESSDESNEGQHLVTRDNGRVTADGEECLRREAEKCDVRCRGYGLTHKRDLSHARTTDVDARSAA